MTIHEKKTLIKMLKSPDLDTKILALTLIKNKEFSVLDNVNDFQDLRYAIDDIIVSLDFRVYFQINEYVNNTINHLHNVINTLKLNYVK